MNDFTKEELKALLNFADIYTEFGASFTYKMYQPLMNKLKSMIENYCEHNWDNWCCNCPIEKIECDKCGRKLSNE